MQDTLRKEAKWSVTPVAGFGQLIEELGDQLRNRKPVAVANFLQKLPVKLLESQAGGNAAQPYRAAATGVKLWIRADEYLACSLNG